MRENYPTLVVHDKTPPLERTGKPRKTLAEMAGTGQGDAGCPQCGCRDVRKVEGVKRCRHCGKERRNV